MADNITKKAVRGTRKAIKKLIVETRKMMEYSSLKKMAG